MQPRRLRATHRPRTLARIALSALSGVLCVTSSAEAQWANRKAVEMALIAVPPGDARVIVSPSMVGETFRGQATLNDENVAPLQERFGAEILEPSDILECRDDLRIETCWIPPGSVVYQFVMPEPIRQGRLNLRFYILRNAESGRAPMRRELWHLELAEHPQLGWQIAGQNLEESVTAPW